MRAVRTWATDWAEASAMADERGAGVLASTKPFASLGILLLKRQAIYFHGIAGSRDYRAVDERLLQHVKD